ncbi:MAG: ATP phosphoribosyltransferase [Acholeplasmatales bacterium]|nr:MAG: ATP phosphoribosyltransferase [Acholeplasmatales bacterium]
MRETRLIVALPKGRLGEDALATLRTIGYAQNIPDKTRRLIMQDADHDVTYLFVKPVDVITYVEQGVADVGIIGLDSLLEADADVYTLADLGFGQCRFAVAGPLKKTGSAPGKTWRIATKYPRVTAQYYAKTNRTVEIIKLNGSVELAPLVGLSDAIVDIVETGSTLKANGLEIYEEMFALSARLIANRASYRLKYPLFKALLQKLDAEREDA